MVGFYPQNVQNPSKIKDSGKPPQAAKFLLFSCSNKRKNSVFSVLTCFCVEGGMSSEGDPSEHVAEPILDGEMLSVTDSETER